MKLTRVKVRATIGYTSFGSMWEKGKITPDKAFFTLKGENGNIPVQSRVTAYWPDGSVKWAAHTASADIMGESVSLDLAVNQDLGDEIEIKENEGML